MEQGGIIKHDENNAPKTGQWKYVRPEVDASKCMGCGLCVRPCPDAVMKMRKRTQAEKDLSNDNNREREIVEIDLEYCKGCGVCAAVCPMKAIIMKK